MKALNEINKESEIINSLCDEWGVEKSMIFQTANRFFTDWKKYGTRIKKLDEKVLDLQIKLLLASSDMKVIYHNSDHENPSVYISLMKNYAESLNNSKKGAIFYNDDYIYGMLGDPSLLPEANMKKYLDSLKKENVDMKYSSQSTVSVDKKKKVNVYQFMVFHKFTSNVLSDFFKSYGFNKI